MKTALQIVKNGDNEDRKAKEQAKEQAQIEKANKWTDSSSADWSEDNPSRKEPGGRWLSKTAWKVTLRREKGALHKWKQSY